ncbi:chloride channel protein, partial [Borreliella burgdorferi]
EIKIHLKSHNGYLFSRLYAFLLLFFIIGLFFTFIFNLILPYIIAQRNEYKFSYDRYNLLESEANEISLKIKHIDISLAANRFFLSSDLTDSMKQKRKHLENLIRIYDKMRIIYVNNEELLTNYYLVKSEYSKIPSYDVDLEKVKKTFSKYPLQSLKKQDFFNIVNEFISKNDYYTANYFAYIAYVATKDDNFVVLLNLTLKFINENRNFEKEKMQLISEEKQKNFLFLNTEKFKLAYYGFSNLYKLLPSDNEILNYKNKSLEKLRKRYLFFDEIEKYFEYYGINDVFLLQPDSKRGFYDYIYMQKVVAFNNHSKIIKNFELIRFNNTGNVILHIKIPFATLKGNSVYQNILDKDNEQSEITLTKVFVSTDSFDTNVLEVVKINENVENLALFSNFTEFGFFLKIQNLPSAFHRVAILNLKLINTFSLSLVLLISPISLVLIGAFFISLFSKIEFNFNSKAMIFLVSLMIAIFSGITCLFVNYFLIVFTSLLIYVFNSVYVSLAILSALLFFLIFKIITLNYKERLI